MFKLVNMRMEIEKQKVATEMGKYCCEHHGFIPIRCLDGEGKMLPKEEISDAIMAKIAELTEGV